MAPPSQDPNLKKLSGILLNSHKMKEEGVDVGIAYGRKACDVKSMGAAGLNVHDWLYKHGGTMVIRAATVMMVQEMLVRRKCSEPQEVRLIVKENLGPHPLVDALYQHKGAKWFTITRAQELEINTYLELENKPHLRARYYFQVKEVTPEPGRTAISVSSGSREPTPMETTGPRNVFHGQLQGVNFASLRVPTALIPGNIVPQHLLNCATTSGGLNLRAGDTPITMLGEACAREWEQKAKGRESKLLQLVNMQHEAGTFPNNLADMKKQDLVHLVTQRALHARTISDRTGELLGLVRQEERARSQQWQNAFVNVSADQASNPRPGLYSPALPGHDEFQQLHPGVQALVPRDRLPGSAPATPAIPYSNSQHRLERALGATPGSCYQPQLPGSGSNRLGRGYWGQATGSDADRLPETPSAGRHRNPVRNLVGAAAQPSYAMGAYDSEEEEHTAWSEQRPLSKHARSSQGGGSAYGRPHKSPSKQR